MAIYSKLSNAKKLTNSSLGAIIDVSNINFTDISSAVLEFLKNISYDETTNSINELYNINTSYLNVSSQFNVKLNDVITFKIDPQGRAEGNSFLVKVAEAKRYRHTDFNDWPLVGIPGEVIYTGVQNQRPQFGEDFIGYLDTRGWVSLTSSGGAVPGLILLTEIGSPIIIPSPLDGTGIVWTGPPNLENNYAPVNTSIYFTDDSGNTFDILTNFVWEKIGIDAKFIPKGKAIIGDGIIPGQFQYIDGNESAGYILTSDGSGNANWAPNSSGLNYSYWEINNYVANVTQTITHNLSTINTVVDFIDTVTNERIDAHVDNYTANSVDVTLSASNASVKAVILSAGGAAGGAGPDTNTWDLLQTAFVDQDYTVGDGTVGDGNKPFQTVAQANLSGAPNIYLKPGTHQLYVESNKRYYAAPGAVANYVSDLGTTATNVKILGDLTVTATFGLNFTGTGSDVYAEILEITGPSASWCDNNSSVYLKVKKGITTSCANGAGYSCRQFGGTMTIETPYYYSNYTIISPRGDGPEFILRCPDVKILDGGVYGNLNQSPIVMTDALLTAACKIEIDLMGGKCLNEVSFQTNTFGVDDSALGNFSNINYAHDIIWKNGTVTTNGVHGFSLYYTITNGTFTCDNIKLKSANRGIKFHNWNDTLGIPNIVMRNCLIESVASNLLGYGMNGDFDSCSFKVTGVQTEIFSFYAPSTVGVPTYTFRDCYGVLVNTGGELFNGFSAATLGLLNSYSTEVIGVGAVDTWGGFTQVPTLTLPNIL